MIWPLWIHPEASHELDEIRRHYDHEQPGLGAEFLNAATHVLDELHHWPKLSQAASEFPANSPIRKRAVLRFPYQIIYVLSDNEIHVIAFAHVRRLPQYWHSRTRNP